VRVIEAQRFTLLPFDSEATIDYHANIANEDVCTPANLAHASEGYERIDWNTADDGSGERIELEAPLSANRESSRVNERRLFAVWAA